MLQFLKTLLGIQDYEDTPKNGTAEYLEFETRVRHFTDKSYIAEYCSRGTWRRFYDPLTLYRSTDGLRAENRYFPMIGSFSECVEFCKKFKCIEDVEAYHEKKFKHWDSLYEAQEKRKRERKILSWSSRDEEPGKI